MSSNWWPLGRTPPPTTTTPTINTSSSTAGPSSTHPATSAAAMRHLAQTAFHANLDSLLVEATKHRGLILLRDAVQDTRRRDYDPASLFSTFCIACSLLAERSGSSGTPSFSNANNAVQAAADGVIEGAHMVLRNSSVAASSALGSGSTNENVRVGASTASVPAAGPSGSAAGAHLHPTSSGSSHALHYRYHGAARELLLQSIGDVGKLIALGLLPVTLSVGQRIADLVREIGFLPSAPVTTTAAAAASRTPLTVTHAHASPSNENDLPSLSDPAVNTVDIADAAATTPVQLVHDDPVLVRLLQLCASAASACPLGSPALPELYGVLILFYSGVAPQSMLEATCEAALTHHIHTVLVALRDNSGSVQEGGHNSSSSGNNSGQVGSPAPAALAANTASGGDAVVPLSTSPSTTAAFSPFTAPLHGIAFMKDICRLMVGAKTRWLHLSLQHSSGGGERGGEAPVSASHTATPCKANSAASSMAAVTASVSADAERQQQLHRHDRTSLGASLLSTPMTTFTASAYREASLASFGSVFAASTGLSVGGGGSVLDSSASPASAAAALGAAPQTSALWCVPERLRGFLMRAVTLFFKEQAGAFPAAPPPTALPSSTEAAAHNNTTVVKSSPEDGLLYAQCLNDCLFSVALWGLYEMDITVPMQPPPSLFVEVMQQQYAASHSSFVCSLDLFTCTQQLALATVSTNLTTMSNTAQILMEAHERLLQRLYRKQKMRGTARSPRRDDAENDNGGDGAAVIDATAERLSQAAIAVLTLWRKNLTRSSLLWELLQLRSAHAGAGVAAAAASGVKGKAQSMMMWMPSPLAFTGGAGSPAATATPFNERHRRSSDGYGTYDYDSDSSAGSREDTKWRTRGSANAERLSDEERQEGKGREAAAATSAKHGARFQHCPQPLTLTRPQVDAHLDPSDEAVDMGGYADSSLIDMGEGITSPRLEMAPLARLVISVVNLIMAYILDAPRASVPPTASLGTVQTSSNKDETTTATAMPLAVTPPHGAHNLPKESDVLLRNDTVMEREEGTAENNAALPRKKKGGGHRKPVLSFCVSASPATVYQCLTEAVNFVTAFGQYFCQLTAKQSGAVGDDHQQLRREQTTRCCAAWLLDIHPYLLRCCALCLRYLRYEEDVLPVALKGIGFWVQASCSLQLTKQRDAFLSLLVRALRMPDPVVGHLIALSPPTSFLYSGGDDLTSVAKTTTSTTPKSAVVVLESLLALHDHYAAREPIVPGSVAAAALNGESIGDFRDPSPGGHQNHSHHGRSSAAATMSNWGIGWLRRRRHATSSRTKGTTKTALAHSRTVSPAQSTAQGGSAGIPTGGSRTDTHDFRTAAISLSAQLTSLGWRAPVVQHVVVLGVCRLQPKILIMKTLHVIANALGAELDGGWALLARGAALTEPLLHMLKRLLTWIEESSVEQEQQEQLLSDALHLRDALRSLCVDNTCRLPYAQLNVFFSGLVKGTAALSPSAPEVKTAGITLSGHSWSAGIGVEESEVDGDIDAASDALFELSESTSPYTDVCIRLPRHDPQGCIAQWVLTSECLCLSLLAMLPFTEQRSGEMSTTAAAASGHNEVNIGSGVSQEDGTGAQAVQRQRQRWGALMRAMRLWQLETDICRYVTDPQRVVHWGTTLITNAAAHERVLLFTCTGQTHTTRQSSESSTTGPLPFIALSEDETRVMELTLTTVVDHVAAVAAHMCRSAARRRSAAECDEAAAAASSVGGSTSNLLLREDALGGRYHRGGTSGNNATEAMSYQAVQSAALVLTAGPFANVKLIQIANKLFASPAGSPSPASAEKDARLPQSKSSGSTATLLSSLLPFVFADAAQSAASILYGLQRAMQASSILNAYAAAHCHDSSANVNAVHSLKAASIPNTTVSSPGSYPRSGSSFEVASVDPLELLLASTFALLDDVYQHGSQAQQIVRALKDESGGRDVARLRENRTEQADAETKPAVLAQASSLSPPQREEMEHSIDNSRPTSPMKQLGNNDNSSNSTTVTAIAAAAAVVAEAVPQLLMKASTTVLMDVVKVVQAYGEDIDGVAWEPILWCLQRTATTVTEDSARSTGEQGARRAGTNRSGSDGGGKAAKGRMSDSTSNVSNAQTVESLNMAFRALESIQHNHIPRLKKDGLHRLIVSIGAFTVHRVDSGVPGERKLHINLSAVQLLWSTADYLAAFGGGGNNSNNNSSIGGENTERQSDFSGIVGTGVGLSSGGGSAYVVDNGEPMYRDSHHAHTGRHRIDAAALTPAQHQDRLWCSLLWQLRRGCLDDRQEIRQSAMQTFFALVQTYGQRFSGACWRCVLHDVLLPLLEVVSAATALCATPAPPLTQKASGEELALLAVASASISSPDPASGSPATPVAAGVTTTDVKQDPAVELLLKAFVEQPLQLEEVRVTLYEAGSRLFVTHYASMQAALQSLARPPTVGVGYGDAGEATAVLEALLQLCGDVCVVVRGTSGEQSAIAAVHALHGLLVEIPGNGLHHFGIHLAWWAMERLLYRGDGPGERVGGGGSPQQRYLAAKTTPGDSAGAVSSASNPSSALFVHTEAKQCTLAVVAAIVAAVCDSFRLQRMMAAHAATATAAVTTDKSEAVYSLAVTSMGASTTVGGGIDPHAPLATDRSPANENGGLAGRFGSYFSGWASKPSKADASTSRSVMMSTDAQRISSQAQYFIRLLFVLQAVTRCNAVVNSYYFPSKAQTTLLEGITAVWPTLTGREARMLWTEVLLPAFPSIEDVKRFVLQEVATAKEAERSNSSNDNKSANTTAAAHTLSPPLVALKTAMPPGSHPSYLSAVMDTMRRLLLLHMGIESTTAANTDSVAAMTTSINTEEDRTRLLFMAPSTIHVTGTLLLLHLASPSILAGSPRAGGVPFTFSVNFLQECADLLQFTLWGPVLSCAPSSPQHNRKDEGLDSGSGGASGAILASDVSLPAAMLAARCRREGVAALCRVFESLLASTTTVVRFVDVSAAAAPLSTPASTTSTTTSSTVPQYVTAALQSVGRLVDTLGEVVRLVMEQYEDVAAATEAINALSLASTAEGTALARVAKRSLALMQRWVDAVSAASPTSPQPQNDSAENEGHGPTSVRHPLESGTPSRGRRSLDEATSRSQLQDVVRASMEARNKAIIKQYVDNPDDGSVSALLVDALHDMLRVAQRGLGTVDAGRHCNIEEGGNNTAYSLEQWDGVMPELLQLVTCCSKETTRGAAAMAREREVRETLSAILAVLYEQHRKRRLSAALQHSPNSNCSSQVTPQASPAPQQQRKRTATITESEEDMSII